MNCFQVDSRSVTHSPRVYAFTFVPCERRSIEIVWHSRNEFEVHSERDRCTWADRLTSCSSPRDRSSCPVSVAPEKGAGFAVIGNNQVKFPAHARVFFHVRSDRRRPTPATGYLAALYSPNRISLSSQWQWTCKDLPLQPEMVYRLLKRKPRGNYGELCRIDLKKKPIRDFFLFQWFLCSWETIKMLQCWTNFSSAACTFE